MRRYLYFIKQNPLWVKIILFNLTLFLIWLADSIIAYWAPVHIEETLKNSVLMGLIISFQSIVGLLSDFVFPTVLKNVSVRRLIILGIIFVGTASLLLTASYFKPFIFMFLITMAIWGFYYEFIAFANSQFVATSVPSRMHSSVWGINNVFANSAYFLGPLIAPYLITQGPITTLATVMVFLCLAFIMSAFSLKSDKTNIKDFNLEKVNPVTQFRHWKTLIKVIWPMAVLTLCLGFIDASFWTIGAVWSQELSKTSFWGGMILPFYLLPSLGVGLIIAKEGIYKGKKLLSEKILILAGICLALMAFSSSLYWQLFMVFLSGLCLSACAPLVQGVYTDIVSRMGHEQKEMIGLTNSVLNIAYIIWPPVIGLISVQIGERLSFSYMGFLAILTGIGLLFITPKKLRLPQTEIASWEDSKNQRV